MKETVLKLLHSEPKERFPKFANKIGVCRTFGFKFIITIMLQVNICAEERVIST